MRLDESVRRYAEIVAMRDERDARGRRVHTLQAIADRYGMTRQRVHTIIKHGPPSPNGRPTKWSKPVDGDLF